MIGAKRAGTSALFALLKQHPQVHSTDKEIHFFDFNYDRGTDWYRSHFDGASPGQIAGEATQTYMFDPQIAPRMFAVAPQAKLIATLRDPTTRAYSEYSYAVARGLETLSFEEALDMEPARSTASYNQFLSKSYFARGLYFNQLSRLMDFYDREQLHVMIFEETVEYPLRAFAGLCDFLGIDSSFVPQRPNQKVNATRAYRSQLVRRLPLGNGMFASGVARLNRRSAYYPPMAEETRRWLNSRYRGPNNTLAEWLGRALDRWGA